MFHVTPNHQFHMIHELIAEQLDIKARKKKEDEKKNLNDILMKVLDNGF